MCLITAMVLRKISQSVTTVNIYSMTVLGGCQLEPYALVCFKIYKQVKHKCYIFVDEVCDEGEVHLVGGDGVSRGRVEYCHNGTWYSVCADGWDTNGEEARYICNAMGYNNTYYGMIIHYNLLCTVVIISLLYTRFSVN